MTVNGREDDIERAQPGRAPARVYKHANSPNWQIEFWVDGVPYRKSAGTANKRLALKRVKQMRDAVLAARKPPLQLADLTFGEAADLYWHDTGQHTRDAAKLDGDLERIVRMVGPERMCSTITTADERRVRAMLRNGERPPGIDGRGRPLKDPNRYSPKTINAYCDLIPRILNHAEIVRNTVFNFRRQRRHPRDSDREIERARYRRMSFEEQRRLEPEMDRDLADAVLFDLETGMREDALCSLCWRQIDWSLCTVTFELKEQGWDPAMHEVELTPEAMAILYRRKAMHAAKGVTSDRVFMMRVRKDHWYKGVKRRKGQLIPVSPKLLLDRFTEACAAASIVDLTFHDLRRTAGRRVYEEEGSDIEAARAFLGHRNVEQTKIYLGVTGTAINKHLRRRSARTRLAMAELDAAATRGDAAPGTRAHALHLVVSEHEPPRCPPKGVSGPARPAMQLVASDHRPKPPSEGKGA